MDHKISIIIPTLNEEKSIHELVLRLHNTLSASGFTYELIFIDDNSTDDTFTIINTLAKKYPIFAYIKKGKKGKAYSLIEGIDHAKYAHIGIIDADLQYPPEEMAAMALKLSEFDVVVANRTAYKASRARKFISRAFRYGFGKVLFGLNYDIQAGMKVFKKTVIETIEFKPVSGWTFDLEFLNRATHAGYKIGNHPIVFSKRTSGKSKVGFISSSVEIGLNAVSVKTKGIKPQHIKPENTLSMKGAGVGHNRKKFITHTTLNHKNSAIKTFILGQKIIIAAIFAAIATGLYFNLLLTLQILIAVLSVIYFLDVLFNLLMVLRSLHFPQEIEISEEKINALKDSSLPVYTILCPMYKEGHIIKKYLDSMAQLDYPKDKLDIILLLEEDDKQSQMIVETISLPSYVRALVVPQSFPKTKPKACNYGLAFAKGEYLVVYDAEDIPEPSQLKKAFIAFKNSPENVRCLQAKLNYHNPHQNLLTRFFTQEYSLWFDVTLPGYQSINTSIPLGGTSNHFRTKDLLDLEGWDPFNVTEDADLGTRLFKKGYLTAVIDSVTLEEANSKWGNWVRQRSRWIKGYMQTYLVHMRNPMSFTKSNGHHVIFFNLIVGGKIAFILINPFLWIATIAYFALYAYVGPQIERLYPTYIFYMAVFSLVFGNFLYLFYYMIGAMKREQYSLIKYTFVVPFYWLMISVAGFYALYQLILKPHYWEKTTHGLDILKDKKKIIPSAVATFEQEKGFIGDTATSPRFYKKLQKRHAFGFLLIAGLAAGSFFNFLYNAYLGRVLSLENFALIGLVSSLLSIFWIISGILGKTVTLQSGFLIGKFGEGAGFAFWKSIRKTSLIASVIISLVWILLSPFTASYLQLNSNIPLLLFIPVLMLGLVYFVDTSFLASRLRFGSLAFIAAFETGIKFAIAVSLVALGFSSLTYAAIPLSIILAFAAVQLLNSRTKTITADTHIHAKKFPKMLFAVSALSGIATICFLSMDVIFAKHYLPTPEAGLYALTALIGKMILFLGGLASPFIIPLVSRNEGALRDSRKVLNLTLLGTLALVLPASAAFIGFGHILIPFLFGTKALGVLPYIPLITVSMVCLGVSKVYTDYYLAKKLYSFTVVGLIFSVIELILLMQFHASVYSIILSMSFVWITYASVILLLHAFSDTVRVFENNFSDFIGLFMGIQDNSKKSGKNLNILILNWRDTKHKWAGGAEVYVHELGKNWIKAGHTVTLFCGNDGHAKRNEIVEGIQVVRRGGFYTVYMWAFLYYVLRFKGSFDVIVDAENGIPFFTPFYSRAHKVLLIHHVHQEVFRKNLKFPMLQLALFLEAHLMPFAYRNTQVVTVSPSSKKEIMRHKMAKFEPVIIHNGVNLDEFKPTRENEIPLILYLGRIQKYKSLHVFIHAAREILLTVPSAEFIIAGEGEEKADLQKYVHEQGLEQKIKFTGRVTQKEKIELMQKAWVFVNPSFMEGWGITTIEANACGTPAVASDVPGLRDSVLNGETGLLAKYGSHTDFAKQITTLILDPKLRRTLSRNAIQWSQNFSWDKSSKEFTLLFNKKRNIKGTALVMTFQE